jgi:hypothetical protein
MVNDLPTQRAVLVFGALASSFKAKVRLAAGWPGDEPAAGREVLARLPNGGAATVITLSSSVTAPVSAKTRPVTLVPVVTVSLAFARMLPTKTVSVPRVAELPTCQNTFAAVAPLARTTDESLAVVSVLPIWKTYTPLPLSVRVPVNCAEESKQ